MNGTAKKGTQERLEHIADEVGGGNQDEPSGSDVRLFVTGYFLLFFSGSHNIL
jgi:hypothetical protein